ncbi:MAG: vWA domain-containing protein [Natronospirillum sp.]
MAKGYRFGRVVWGMGLRVADGFSLTGRRLLKVGTALWVGLVLLASSVSAQNGTPPLDVRILVDVSGSMQEHDPNNLRVPASHLLIELLPDGSRAGLWTFGREVNMLVPYGTVDSAWRANARQMVGEIGSPGFNSNVGGTLDTASFDFDWSTGLNPKDYVLLSDGVVDVPPDEAAGQAERRRILTELVPRYRLHNATIHTVRLSDHSDALFMEQLAAQTGGNNYLAQRPEDLLGLILQVLDIAVGGQEEVTLDAQQAFLVDDSISEFTATILHGTTDNSALTLISPSGQRFTQDSPPTRAEWSTRDRYDLITVRQPDAGEWRVEGDLDPESRITVISDLNLQVDSIPLNAAEGGVVPVQAVINDVSGQVTDLDFLQLLDLRVTLQRQGERQTTVAMNRVDSAFEVDLSLPEESGTYQLVVEADGQTFQRRRVYTVNVRAPIALEVTPIENTYELSIYANLPDLTDDLRRFLAEIQQPDGEVLFLPFEQQESGQWAVRVAPNAGAGVYNVLVDPQFPSQAGARPELQVSPVQLTFPVAGSAPIQIAVERPEPEPEPEPEPVLTPVQDDLFEITMPAPIEPLPPEQADQEIAPAPPAVDDDFLAVPPESSRNLMPYAIAAGGGLAFVLLLYLAYRLLNGRDPADDDHLTEKEKVALRDLENYLEDDDMAEDLMPVEPLDSPDEQTIPTVDEALTNDPSILDDDFDLESLGIGDNDEDDDLDVERQLDEEVPLNEQPAPIADNDEELTEPDGAESEDMAANKKRAQDDPFAAEEFDLSDDEIDDMLDDSLSEQGKNQG